MKKKINSKKEKALKEWKLIPNVGPAVAEDLVEIGIFSIEEMHGKNPDVIYAKMIKKAGTHVDRCMLYVIRSLVYMAETGRRDMKHVAWWLFKDAV